MQKKKKIQNETNNVLQVYRMFLREHDLDQKTAPMYSNLIVFWLKICWNFEGVIFFEFINRFPSIW